MILVYLILNNISTLSKYDENNYTLTKSNEKIVFNNKVNNKDQFKVVHEITIKRITFGEDDNYD